MTEIKQLYRESIHDTHVSDIRDLTHWKPQAWVCQDIWGPFSQSLTLLAFPFCMSSIWALLQYSVDRCSNTERSYVVQDSLNNVFLMCRMKMHSGDFFTNPCTLTSCLHPLSNSLSNISLIYLTSFNDLSLTESCLPPHILPFCRWCACAKTPNWLWRTAPLTSWTCCQTPTSTCAPSCLATRAKWRPWGTTSTSGSSWRT